jgi:transcriptional regulator with PAS, ATPase and Fis domain
VKGWVAEIIPCVDSTKPNKVGETYSIRKCPNYLKDTPKLSKTCYVEKLAKELGISVTTLYRRMRKSENV